MDDLFDEEYIGEDLMVTEKGFELLNQADVRIREDPPVHLTALEELLLARVNRSMTDKSLSNVAKVDLDTVSAKLDKLYDMDLITSDLMLSKKGFNFLHRQKESVEHPRTAESEMTSGERTRGEPIRTVVIQREIVKIPCRYCRTLNEMTERTCSSCGAAIT